MPYGYLGQNQPNQTVSNSGVFSITDVAELQSQGKLGGSLELIEEQTVSNVTYLDFTNIQQNKYDVHYLTVENYQNSTNADDCIIQLFESGVIETASVYLYGYQEASSSNRFDEYRSTGDNKLFSLTSSGNSASRSGNGYMYLYNAGNSSKYTFGTFHSVGDYSTILGHSLSYFGGGVLPQASEVDGIRIASRYYTSTSSFTAKLYGVKQI
jgi:hypothetical protein